MIKNTIAISICAFMVLLLAGCKKDRSMLNVQMSAVYNGQAYALNTPNTDAQGRQLKFQQFKYYISHLALVKNDNTETELKDVALIDFAQPSTFNIISNLQIEGDYKAIKFYVGVDSTQNETDPNTANGALRGDNDMHWPWLKYVFIHMEGKCDTSTSGSPTFNVGLTYHTGGNNLYHEVLIEKSISVCCGNTANLNIQLDVNKIFNGASQTVDPVTESVTNTDDYPVIASKVTENFANAFSLQ